MTSQPEVPGATAVYLNREEITEDSNTCSASTSPEGAHRRWQGSTATWNWTTHAEAQWLQRYRDRR